MAKRPDDEVRAEVEQRMREIELLRQEAEDRGLKFTALSEEELARKASRESSQSPYIYTQAWSSITTPGATAIYNVSVANPDLTDYYPSFITIFFGLANFMADISLGPAGRNPEWPYVSSEAFQLAPGATADISFTYNAPLGITLGTYIGNAVLWSGRYHDQGAYFARSPFEVTLT